MKTKLTKSDLKRNIFFTLGQIKGAIKSGREARALALLDKAFIDASDMDVKIARLERELKELKHGKA